MKSCQVATIPCRVCVLFSPFPVESKIVKQVPAAPAHSTELADNIAAAIRGQEDRIKKQAAAALAPRHGLFVLGKDLAAAFDAVERIDGNAYCILFSRMLSGS